MITYKNGNLLEADEKLIAHGCNNRGVMGSGVAKVIRAKWPKAYEEYAAKDELPMGSVIYVDTDNKIIANCITQDGFGRDGKRYVDYIAIKQCFADLNEFCKTNEIDNIAIPQIGAGLGGGDWDTIESIIMVNMKDAHVTVYII